MLPADMLFLERGWLSSNCMLLIGPEDTALIDAGYHSHVDQTLSLLRHGLRERTLTTLLNTHLHSDHCGGNAAIQACWPDVRTLIPPGCASYVPEWDERGFTYRPTGQFCPRFSYDATLEPGSLIQLAGRSWEIHAAPGHDQHSILLFQPDSGVLLSADALWEKGFGVVFPEIEGNPGFADVANTLNLIEKLQPRIIVPGHGPIFTDLDSALGHARERLMGFMNEPIKHANHAAKVMIKFHMMAIHSCTEDEFLSWMTDVEYLHALHEAHFADQSYLDWGAQLILSLCKNGVLSKQNRMIVNI